MVIIIIGDNNTKLRLRNAYNIRFNTPFTKYHVFFKKGRGVFFLIFFD